jgi:hypothetical protein
MHNTVVQAQQTQQFPDQYLAASDAALTFRDKLAPPSLLNK